MTDAERRAGTPHLKDVGDFYGTFRYQANPKMRGWILVEKTWMDNNIISVPTSSLPGFPPYASTMKVPSSIRLHRKVAQNFITAWGEAFRAGATKFLRTYDGAYTPRHIASNPNAPLSIHAYGAAIDFDARWNGYGLPADKADISRMFIKIMEEHGWASGLRWKMPLTDGMHLEFVQQRSDADWSIAPFHNVEVAEPAVSKIMKIIPYDNMVDLGRQDLVIRVSLKDGKVHIDAQ